MFLWRRLISLGIRPGMSFGETKAVHLLNLAGVLMALVGFLFAILNFIQHNWGLLPFNLAIFGLAVAGLLLIARGFRSAALAVICFGGGLCYFIQSLLYGNGTESTLLLYLVINVTLMEAVWARRLIACLCCLGFLVVQAVHLKSFQLAPMFAWRYLIDFSVSVFCLYGFTALIRTVTDQYQQILQEEKAKLAAAVAALGEANRAKERLFGIVSHDLREPIGHLQESLTHLLEGRLTPERFEPLQEILKADVDTLFVSMENLLQWSASQLGAIAPRFEPLSLQAVCGEGSALLARVAENKRIAIENAIPAEAAVRADPGQLQSIFRNLLSNALKFTEPGGRIRIEAHPHPDTARWEIAVRDQGVGIAPERIGLLLSEGGAPGESTRGTGDEKGLGLGLRICRDFIHSHGGTLRIESQRGQGSSFFFDLPSI